MTEKKRDKGEMNTMKTFTKTPIALAILALAVCLTQPANAQTILSTTTLGAAITDRTCSTQQITLASTSTMLSAGSNNQPNTALYVDLEYMEVVTVVDSTHVTVRRCKGIGAGSRPYSHVNGATVWFSITANGIQAAKAFNLDQPTAQTFGQCIAANELFLPKIYIFSGDKLDCLGVGAAGQWTLVNRAAFPTLGAVYTVPAGAIVPPGSIFLTDSGTAAATSITVPNGWAPGMCLQIIPGGAFTWTTAGNIRAAGTAVAGKVIFFCWDGAKWDANI